MRRVHSFLLQSVARIVRERDPGEEYYVDPDAPGFLDQKGGSTKSSGHEEEHQEEKSITEGREYMPSTDYTGPGSPICRYKSQRDFPKGIITPAFRYSKHICLEKVALGYPKGSFLPLLNKSHLETSGYLGSLPAVRFQGWGRGQEWQEREGGQANSKQRQLFSIFVFYYF